VSYAASTRPPRTLTDREVAKLLKVTGEHRAGFRDHVIFSLALGCALRESEIVALDVGDVSDGTKVKRIIQLRTFKRAGAGADAADHRVHVPDATWFKLTKYVKGLGDVAPTTPLFSATKRNQNSKLPVAWRLSTRRVRELFGEWQRRAGFDQVYNFHTLRHTAITNVRRATGDIRIAQRFGRHVNIGTTVRYEHASDEELAAAVRKLPA
jgi:integrase